MCNDFHQVRASLKSGPIVARSSPVSPSLNNDVLGHSGNFTSAVAGLGSPAYHSVPQSVRATDADVSAALAALQFGTGGSSVLGMGTLMSSQSQLSFVAANRPMSGGGGSSTMSVLPAPLSDGRLSDTVSLRSSSSTQAHPEHSNVQSALLDSPEDILEDCYHVCWVGYINSVFSIDVYFGITTAVI